MEFTEFIQLLKPIIGGSYNTGLFTRTIFEAIVTADGELQIRDISTNTFKAYYNGKTKITTIAKRILPYIDPEQFVSYLDNFPDATIQRLCSTFQPYIKDMDWNNASEKIAYFFEDILKSAASKKRKSTHKSAEEDLIEIPNEQSTTEYSYSSEDMLLLQEFTSDYDQIMITIIGENYASFLIDMSLPNKIHNLYTTKWQCKAEEFSDLSLKSYVYGLLGELNKLYDNLFSINGPSSIKQVRVKIRNLYVKLHPDSYAKNIPYDAFIDDWNDGELY